MGLRAHCCIGSSGNEDELATGKGRLSLPRLSGLRKWHCFPLDRAAAGSGMRENLGERYRFLFVCQRVVGVAEDGVQPAAEDSRLKARGGTGSSADVDQPSLSGQHANGGFRWEAPHRVDDEV